VGGPGQYPFFRAHSQNYEKRLLALSCLTVFLCVHLHETTRLLLDGFSCNLIFQFFFEHLSSRYKFSQNLTRIIGVVCKDQFTFMIISCSVLLRSISVKIVGKMKPMFYSHELFFYCRVGQATDDSLACAPCMVDY